MRIITYEIPCKAIHSQGGVSLELDEANKVEIKSEPVDLKQDEILRTSTDLATENDAEKVIIESMASAKGFETKITRKILAE